MSEGSISVNQSYKLYVEAGVVFEKDGRMIPRWIRIGDTRYEIDRVLDCRRAASMKAGGCGMRYTVQCRGQQAYLFYEDTEPGTWFVESREPVPVSDS